MAEAVHFQPGTAPGPILPGKQSPIGGDMSAAAGPVGRRTSAETNVTMDAAIYSYSRSKGAFAGVSVDGAGIGIDQDANAAYYGRPVSVAEIVRRDVAPPSTAVRLRNKVDSLAP
jgi:lipid-binding SYLF domain-containing protein